MTATHLTDEERKARTKIGAWAAGNYMSVCCHCDGTFMGDKRAKHCKGCALALEQLNRLTAAEKGDDVEEVHPYDQRRRDLLDWIERNIGTGWECSCGISNYHQHAYECQECGKQAPDLHVVAFRLGAALSDPAGDPGDKLELDNYRPKDREKPPQETPPTVNSATVHCPACGQHVEFSFGKSVRIGPTRDAPDEVGEIEKRVDKLWADRHNYRHTGAWAIAFGNMFAEVRKCLALLKQRPAATRNRAIEIIREHFDARPSNAPDDWEDNAEATVDALLSADLFRVVSEEEMINAMWATHKYTCSYHEATSSQVEGVIWNRKYIARYAKSILLLFDGSAKQEQPK